MEDSIMNIRSSILFLPFCLILVACGSGNEALRNGGILSGDVQQILHHGAYDPDGPNHTITTLEGVHLIVNDSEGEEVATLTTDREGKFEIALPPGSYIVIPPDLTDEDVPSSAPSPARVEIEKGTEIHLNFQYAIFAP